MFRFLIPLCAGFIFNSASAFTTFYAQRLGEQKGRLVTIILRDVLGIPIWALGYIIAVRAPAPWLFTPPFFILLLAWSFILTGVVVIGSGVATIRWRAAAPSLHDRLETHGIYAHIRHPLYSGMLLELAGLFLLVPNLAVCIACIIGVLWLMVQARLEEWDLLQRLPAYREYMQKVPRFIPRRISH